MVRYVFLYQVTRTGAWYRHDPDSSEVDIELMPDTSPAKMISRMGELSGKFCGTYYDDAYTSHGSTGTVFVFQVSP